jgi:proline iminopeptidase
MRNLLLLMGALALSFFLSCNGECTCDAKAMLSYHDNANRDDILTGGIKLIPVSTPKGTFNVWTKRTGNNPKIKVLFLHGGPGGTHEYWECMDSYLPKEGIEYYYYDQLESYYSDKPNDSTIWNIEHYVSEVDQVRQALGMNKDNFYLVGHSWGGILAIEYALAHQNQIKGLIISNMVPSIPDYMSYAEEVLGPQLDPAVLSEIKALEAKEEFTSQRYIDLVFKHYYPEHVLRMPLADWPEPVNRAFNHNNNAVYVAMQGPSEFGIVGNAYLKGWDRKADLPKITVPTLTIGGQYDTMDPKQMEWTAQQVQKGRYLHCAKGSHMSMYDDQKTYMSGLIKFIKDVDQGTF